LILSRYTLISAAAIVALSGCTQQLPNSFRYKQQEEKFAALQNINTKVDLLWVVDNSASMDVAQNKLRAGFDAFARTYMQPTWDIRLAVITTDTYMANSAFSNYRNRTVPGSVGYISPYIVSRLATFQNPSWNTSLVNLSTGALTNGVKYGELVPTWNANFAKLIPGMHDGPIPGFCFDGMPYFLKGLTRCNIRDDQTLYNGPENCLNPAPGQSSITQCVNTIENNTVRSGKAIIETRPPTGVPANAVWTQNLVNNSIINLTTGSVGQGSERGLGSILQLLNDNESTSTAFFRPGTIRGIIIVSDEEDQTMVTPAQPSQTFNPFTDYKCDQASLIALNGAAPISGVNGYCCSNSSNNCQFGALGTSCPSKTVDGYTYTISVCADESKLVPVSSVKQQIDTFFSTLDGGGAQNYFVSSIVPLTGATIQQMQADRNTSDTAVGTLKTHAVDRGDRYIELGNLVGNGSAAMDIGASDYSPILDTIGRTILEKAGTFTLSRTATNKSEMTITIIRAAGGTTVIQNNQYDHYSLY
jgi:hypothetical protein